MVRQTIYKIYSESDFGLHYALYVQGSLECHYDFDGEKKVMIEFSIGSDDYSITEWHFSMLLDDYLKNIKNGYSKEAVLCNPNIVDTIMEKFLYEQLDKCENGRRFYDFVSRHSRR